MRRVLFLSSAILVASCGGPQPSHSAADTNREMLNHWMDEMHKLNETCNAGKTIDCIAVAENWLNPPPYATDFKPSPDKASAYLMGACMKKMLGVEGNDPTKACVQLFDKKLITTAKDAYDLCRVSAFACDSVLNSKLLDEDMTWQLCLDQGAACTLAVATVNTNQAHKIEVSFLSFLNQISSDVTGAMVSQVMDDDPAAGDANQCHKDTDCKGDRICEGGSCVDPSAKKTKPAGAPEPKVKFGHADCDAIAQATVKPTACPRAKELAEQIDLRLATMKALWDQMDKGRQIVIGAQCAKVAKDLPDFLTSVCSK